MYCSVNDVAIILPPSVTIGSKNIGTPTVGGQQIQKNQMTQDDVITYIKYASQELDSRLRPIYTCPLRKIKVYETENLSYIPSGLNVSVKVYDSGSFAKGMVVRIQNKFSYENVIVSDVLSEQTVVFQQVINTYSQYDSKLSIVEYPDPIPLITARMALSYGFDKLFVAQQAPDVSNYGVTQRQLAMNAVDNILAGSIVLLGQEFHGKRFVRTPVLDSYKSPILNEIQVGRENQGK